MEIPAPVRDKIEEARKRLQSQRRWRAWLDYLLPVCGACLILALVSRIVYFPYSAAAVAACAGCGLVTAALLAGRKRVDSFSAAARLDVAEGLKERLSTVTECAAGKSGELVEALVADAQAAAQDCRPGRSLMFRAPRSLPLTLGMAIAVTALMIAPRAFGRSERSLPTVERIALHESIRLAATLKLLEEREMPGRITGPMRKLKEELEGGDVPSARMRLAAVKSQVEEQIAKAGDRDAALEAMRESGILEELGELLAAGAAPEDAGKEAATIMEKDAAAVAEALREVLDRLARDSELRKEVEEALEAARRKDAEALADAMERLTRKMANVPGTDDLKVARNRLEFLEGKLGRAGERQGRKPGEPGSVSSPNGREGTLPEIAAQTALEEAMEREKVPERFRNLVRVYFARSEENMRR